MKREQGDAPVSAPKMKFAPKIPPRKQAKIAARKVEPSETKDAVIDKELLTKLNVAKSDNSFGRRPKAERKGAPIQVAFGHGGSSLIRSFGNPRSGIGSKHEGDDSAMAAAALKEYVEPWDYVRTCYPVTLPLRRPYSGDPEILDQEEFGEDSKSRDIDSAVPPAEELGLLESSIEPQMFLFQFPSVLPFAKPPAAAVDGNEIVIRSETANAGNKGSDNKPGTAAAAESQRNSSASSETDNKSNKGCTLRDLPSGFIGKMLIYKSGKVKMKIGDTLFDVSPGQNCAFAQDAAVINVKDKHCCILGDLPKRIVVTPNVDSLLESIENL